MQKQTFGEVGTRTVIWWQVVSKMFAPKITKICQSFFMSQSLRLWMLFDVFLFISAHMSLVLFFPGSGKTDIGWGGILIANLMASCAENKRTKTVKIGCPFFKWQSIMFGIFFRTRCINIYEQRTLSSQFPNLPLSLVFGSSRCRLLQGAAEKSGPQNFFAVFSATVWDFNMKFCTFFIETFYI